VFDIVEPPGPDADRLSGLSVPVENTATGIAFTTREPVVVRQYGDKVIRQQEGVADPLPPMVRDLDSAVSVPLIAGDETLGVLVVAKFRDRAPFTDTEVQLAKSFAAHAALAVQFAGPSRTDDGSPCSRTATGSPATCTTWSSSACSPPGSGWRASAGWSRTAPPPSGSPVSCRTWTEPSGTSGTPSSRSRSPRWPRQPALGAAAHGARRRRDARLRARIGFDGPLDSAVPEQVRSDVVGTLHEALSNVARHASATGVAVEISVDRTGRRLTLVVDDNGIGIPAVPQRRSGLANIEERAARWHGTSSARSGPAGGTRLEWTVTLPANRTERP